MNTLDLKQLRNIRWGVRATMALGIAASIAANVLHAESNPVSMGIAAWPPLALLLTVELVSRIPTYRRALAVVRIIATATIAGIAAYVSYWHMVSVVARYGEQGISAYLLPLSVDGLIVVASISLVELAGRIRAAEAAFSTTAGIGEEPVTAAPAGEMTASAGEPTETALEEEPALVRRRGAPARERVLPVAARNPGASTADLAAMAGVSERTVRRVLQAGLATA